MWLDVADTVAGIRAAGERGWADPSRVAVMGGSAGGFTALLVAARRRRRSCARSVSQYGVTDLFDLAATTHRFESRYLDSLVGPLPERAERYRDRSPVARARRHHGAGARAAGRRRQGGAARPGAVRLVDALRAAGAPVEYHVYEGEGHGWSRRRRP